MYLIWSNEHRAWWKPHSGGYTTDIRKAGVYSREKMLDICDRATLDWSQAPNEVPVDFERLPPGAIAMLAKERTQLQVSY